MEELLSFILQKITHHPEEVTIHLEKNPESGSLNFQIEVHADDIGLVIGKNGKNAKSIRNLVNTIALREGTPIQLVFQEKKDAEDQPSP